MPGLDTTGPLGRGPMTGWGGGHCQGDVAQPPPVYAGRGRGGYMRRGGFQSRLGRGYRRGLGRRGRGFGLGGPYAAGRQALARPPVEIAKTELETLKQEAEAYTQYLERIEARIAELEASSKASPKASPKASSDSTDPT
ncbi:MAG: DUF5320 domain-containing protein [Desulfosarcinaceae bacterium]